jgi:GNAT superfamily N-acetyltransferase
MILEGFSISTDQSKLDLELICTFLATQHWTINRTRAVIEKSLEHSLCFGVYHHQNQIGLARVVTDYATFAYLCDVFVLEAFRGKGIGKWLMQTVVSHPDLCDIRRFLLATRDTHGLYAQFGFEALHAPDRWMERFNENA